MKSVSLQSLGSTGGGSNDRDMSRLVFLSPGHMGPDPKDGRDEETGGTTSQLRSPERSRTRLFPNFRRLDLSSGRYTGNGPRNWEGYE